MQMAAASLISALFCFSALAQENAGRPSDRAQQQPAPDVQRTGGENPRPAGRSSFPLPHFGESSSVPDAPQTRTDDHERTPCPEGEFRPCALLGGRPYMRDPLHMTEHDKSVWQGFKHPMILTGTALLLASTVYDIEGTQACLHAGTCREANPIFGSRPSRLRAYSIAMPLNGFLIYLSARQKRRGDGNTAFAALYLSSVVHFYFGKSAYSAAGSTR